MSCAPPLPFPAGPTLTYFFARGKLADINNLPPGTSIIEKKLCAFVDKEEVRRASQDSSRKVSYVNFCFCCVHEKEIFFSIRNLFHVFFPFSYNREDDL